MTTSHFLPYPGTVTFRTVKESLNLGDYMVLWYNTEQNKGQNPGSVIMLQTDLWPWVIRLTTPHMCSCFEE